MKVLVAESCGFCLGVRNAIKMVNQTLETKDEVYSLGDVIHNADVVEKLATAGLKSAKNLDDINSGTVLIRSHGATDAQRQTIKDKGLDIVDATCVLVKRVQKIAKQLHEDGYKVVIIGDKGHPEVQAIVGSAPEVLVIGDENDISHLPARSKLGIICQTTQSPEHFAEVLKVVAKTDFTVVQADRDLATLTTVGIANVNASSTSGIDVSYTSGTANLTIDVNEVSASTDTPKKILGTDQSNNTKTFTEAEFFQFRFKKLALDAAGNAAITRAVAGGLTTYTIDPSNAAAFGGTASALNIAVEVLDNSNGQTVYADITREDAAELKIIFTGTVTDSSYDVLLTNLG